MVVYKNTIQLTKPIIKAINTMSEIAIKITNGTSLSSFEYSIYKSGAALERYLASEGITPGGYLDIMVERNIPLEHNILMWNVKIQILEKMLREKLLVNQSLYASSNFLPKWDLATLIANSNEVVVPGSVPDTLTQIKTLMVDKAWSIPKITNLVEKYGIEDPLSKKHLVLDVSRISIENTQKILENIKNKNILKECLNQNTLELITNPLNVYSLKHKMIMILNDPNLHFLLTNPDPALGPVTGTG